MKEIIKNECISFLKWIEKNFDDIQEWDEEKIYQNYIEDKSKRIR